MSEAVTLYVTALPAGSSVSTFWLPGTVSVGGVVSTTVTSKGGASVKLPASSVALHWTVVVPIPKLLPDGWLQLIVGFGSTLSVAAIVHETGAPFGAVASVVGGEGRGGVNVGG